MYLDSTIGWEKIDLWTAAAIHLPIEVLLPFYRDTTFSSIRWTVRKPPKEQALGGFVFAIKRLRPAKKGGELRCMWLGAPL